jgi:BirA family biotin operon repressor/biotin-[acetyl-CoA-carboxylase] ligase
VTNYILKFNKFKQCGEKILFDIKFLRSRCSESGFQIGKKIYYFDEIESTSDALKKMAKNGEDHGSIVIANRQISGHGRRGRAFFSPDLGLYMSILLRDKLNAELANFLTIISSLAVSDAIDEIADVKTSLKWPNDILLNNKKICGILVETSLKNSSLNIDYAVVGIGVNVASNLAKFPKELINKASTICAESGKCFELLDLTFLIIKNFNEIYGKFLDGKNNSQILSRYKDKLALLGKKITVIRGGDTFAAVARDIDEFGHLLVEKDGKIEKLLTEEVSVRFFD